MRTTTTTAAALALAAFTTAAPHARAGVHAGDIILTTDGGAIVTNAIGPDGAEPQRVFTVELNLIAGFWSAANPGFDTDPGTFTFGDAIGFVIEDAVRQWNGADFDTIADSQISIEFGPAGPVFSPLTPDTDVVGFDIPVQSNGGWHKHYDYFLEDPADQGVYLLRVRLTHSGALDDTEPFYLVFNQSRDEPVVSAAIAYVSDTLLAPPCPTDLNGDGATDTADLGLLISAFGTNDPAADLNDDNIVDTADLGVLIGGFGQPCG